MLLIKNLGSLNDAHDPERADKPCGMGNFGQLGSDMGDLGQLSSDG